MDTPKQFTYKKDQVAYRKILADFFSDKDNLERLNRIARADAKICNTIFYFIKHYNSGRLIKNKFGLMHTHSEYRNAIAKNHKRFYNFESKEGKGDLVWEGKVNPHVFISDEAKCFTLPCLVAIKWFIENEYDNQFWMEYQLIVNNCISYNQGVKLGYTRTHREKKRKLRAECEELVLSERPEKSKSKPISRLERKRVIDIMDLKQKETIEKKKKVKRKRSKGNTGKEKLKFFRCEGKIVV